MKIESLEIFAKVAQSEGFGAAARELDLDASAVSRSIARLESEIGVRLFQRNTRQISLTEAGSIFLERAESILYQLEQAKNDSVALGSGTGGTIRFTAPISFGQACIVPLLGEFAQLYPDLRLVLKLTNTPLNLIAERLDLAIRMAPQVKGDYIATKLFDTQYRLCATEQYLCNKKSIVEPEDLYHHDLLSYPEPSYQVPHKFTDADGRETEIVINSKILISDTISLKSAMLDSLGPALLSHWVVDREIEKNRCRRLLSDYQIEVPIPEKKLWIIYPGGNFLPNKVRLMIEFLKKKTISYRQPDLP